MKTGLLTGRYQVAVISGASAGIGAALAREFASQGIAVALLARREQELTQLANEIIAAGGRALALPCDIGVLNDVNKAIARVEAELGPIDLVVANAGVAQVMHIDNLDCEKLERTYRVNVLGAIYLMAAALPGMMKRKKGHLVAISSLASIRGYPGFMAYSGSKSALNREMEAIRNRVHRYGITASTICPGFIETDMTADQPIPQPFKLKVDDGIRLMVRAIAGRKRFYLFPWQSAFMASLMGWVPNFVFDICARLLDHQVSTRRLV